MYVHVQAYVYLCLIYVIYFLFLASFSLSLIIQPPSNRFLCFLYIFQNISYYFWMITWMKKGNSFQMAEVQPQGVTQFLLDFFVNFSLVLLIKMLLIKKRVMKPQRKVKIDVSCYFHSFPRGLFRTLSSIYDGNLFAKIVNNFKSINIFAKCPVSDASQGMCLYCGNRIPSWLS